MNVDRTGSNENGASSSTLSFNRVKNWCGRGVSTCCTNHQFMISMAASILNSAAYYYYSGGPGLGKYMNWEGFCFPEDFDYHDSQSKWSGGEVSRYLACTYLGVVAVFFTTACVIHVVGTRCFRRCDDYTEV